MRMRTWFALVIGILAVSPGVFAQCGVERWAIKTGTDSGAFSVSLSSYISSTIYNFRQSTRPSSIPTSSRVAPRETTYYQLSGTLTKYVKESDKDYHLVIQDGSGRTMIIELADPNCASGSAWGSRIANARSQFDARFTATTTMKSTSTSVTVRGIGFWDYLHGQTGVAPNGIEMHPVLNITFGTAAVAPGVSPASIDEDGAIVDVVPDGFVRDDDGGLVQVYRGGEAVPESVLHHGGAIVQDPSIQVVWIGEHAERREDLQDAREFNSPERLMTLDRYGVRGYGLRVDGTSLPSIGTKLNDLDVQRALSNAVESGRLQQADPDTIFVVLLEPGTEIALGGTTDFLSYNTVFHPSETPMRYVVVRSGLDPAARREAIYAGVARAAVNPNGNGWF